MAKKIPSPPLISTTALSKPQRRATLARLYRDKSGLRAYIEDPEAYYSSPDEPDGWTPVIYHNDDWVLIRDLFPKSAVHLLLISRNPKYYSQRPNVALQDPEFLESARKEITGAKDMVASDLRHMFGKFSVSEKARIEAMESEELIPYDQLPPGRDWSKEVIHGVHSNPSMSHLHIHILSRDRNAERMNKAAHYNSFNTRFLVPLEDFPLPKDDSRLLPEKIGQLLHADMTCWRCGRNFLRRFAQLKRHLDEEFEEWKRL